MDGFINSKIEKQTIYEIYRGCRLCGAGAGYKMPIIQNVVHLDGTEVELKQKIRDCVQIEVHQDDKMPPLICELCVDKVNDFYEFLEMCRQTNKRTRLRLGLPPQTLPRGAPDAGDCILGVTEPIFVGNEDSNEPILKYKGKNAKSSKGKKEFQTRDVKNKVNVPQKKEIKKEVKIKIEPRTLRSKAPSPPSPPRLRGTKRHHEGDRSPSRLQKTKNPELPTPKSILKRNSVNSDPKLEDSSIVKRLRDKDIHSKPSKEKKVKIVLKPSSSRVLKSSKPCTKQDQWKCKICRTMFNSTIALSNHMRSHTRCKHVEQKPAPKKQSQPRKLECKTCKREFLHKNMLDIHRCNNKPVKPSRPVAVQKPVAKPQRTLPSRKKPIDPNLLKQVRPFQVRTARCDPLLENKMGDHFDVSNVEYDFGLDKNCVYPFISTFRNLRIKSEPGYMVNIQDEIKDVFDMDENYVHWDSADETDSDLEFTTIKQVESLTSLTLKTIYSPKLLGKVARKRRKIKVDKAFDSILNASDYEPDIRKDIHNIIDSLDDKGNNDKSTDANDSVTNDKIDKSHDDNDSLFGDDKSPAVTNDDFDSLFNSSHCSNINKLDVDAKSKDKDTNVSNKVNGNISRNELNSGISALSLSDNDTIKDAVALDINAIDKLSDGDSKSILSNVVIPSDKNEGSVVLETENIEHMKDNECMNNSKKLDESEEENCISTDKVNDSKIDCTDNIKLDDNPKLINDIEYNKCNESTYVDIDYIKLNEKIANTETDEIRIQTSNVQNLVAESDNKIYDNTKSEDSITRMEKDSKRDEDTDFVIKNTPLRANGLDLDGAFNMDDLEDVSDSEMEDRSLMEALDAQIYDSVADKTKSVCDRDIMLPDIGGTVKPTDLENISDRVFE